MKLSVNLRREVADIPAAQQIVDMVVERLADHPEVEISASVNESITIPED